MMQTTVEIPRTEEQLRRTWGFKPTEQKTVQVVIGMSEEKYKWICENNPNTDEDSIIGAIVNGTVLEPHGRCIDVDALVKKYGDKVTFLNGRVDGEYINAPTILEAWRNKK